METNLKLEAPWEEVKEKLKEINISLTDDDLQYEHGQEEKLIDNLSKKLGKSAEETRSLIESVSYNKGKAS